MTCAPILAASLLLAASPADPRAGHVLRADPPENTEYRCVAWSPDGKSLALGTADGRIFRVDASTRCLAEFDVAEGVHSVAFSPNGKMLAAAAGGVGLYETASGRRVWHKADVAASEVAFAPDGNRIGATPPAFGTITILATEGGDSRQIGFRRRVFGGQNYPLSFSADGQAIAAGRQRSSFFLSSESGANIPPLPDRRYWHQTAFTADGRTAFTVEMPYDRDVLVVRRWEWETGQEAGRYDVEPTNDALVFSPNGRRLARVVWPEGVQILDAGTGRPIGATLKAISPPRCLRFSPDGRTLAFLDIAGRLWLWRPPLPPPGRDSPCAERADSLWAALDSDAASAYGAMDTLHDEPTEAVALLAERLGDGPPPDVTAFVAALSSRRFTDRDAAERGLLALGLRARPALVAAGMATESAEVRDRIGRVLTADALRRDRIRVLLGRIGTPEARELLARMRGEAVE